ncbi:MAG: hypothetical protein ACKN81_15025, partial [Pirellulaceae bacterium]
MGDECTKSPTIGEPCDDVGQKPLENDSSKMPIPNGLKIGIRWILTKSESFRTRTAIALLLTVLTVGLTVGALLRLGVRFALQRNIDLVMQEDSEDLLE